MKQSNTFDKGVIFWKSLPLPLKGFSIAFAVIFIGGAQDYVRGLPGGKAAAQAVAMVFHPQTTVIVEARQQRWDSAFRVLGRINTSLTRLDAKITKVTSLMDSTPTGRKMEREYRVLHQRDGFFNASIPILHAGTVASNSMPNSGQ